MTENEFKKRAGRNLRKVVDILVDDRRITMQELYDLLGVGRSGMDLLLNGKNGITPYKAYLLKERFGITADWLYLDVPHGLPHWIAERLSPRT